MNIAYGISQVILQKSKVAGMLFVLGWLTNSWAMTVGGLLGLFLGDLLATTLKAKKEHIEDGLYGYNTVLVGIATVFFFGWSGASLLLMVGGCVVATLLQFWMLKKFPLKSLTAPFVMATWGVYVAGQALGLAAATHAAWFAPIPETVLTAPLTGIGQIMFQGNALSGLLFLAGVAYASPRAGVFLLLGAVLGTAFGWATTLFLDTTGMVVLGLFGFNAALVGVALQEKKVGVVVGGVLLSVLLMLVFSQLGFPALTAPFVIATWSMMFFKERKVARQ